MSQMKKLVMNFNLSLIFFFLVVHANSRMTITHASPWKFITQVYPSFSSMLSLLCGGWFPFPVSGRSLDMSLLFHYSFYTPLSVIIFAWRSNLIICNKAEWYPKVLTFLGILNRNLLMILAYFLKLLLISNLLQRLIDGFGT